MKALSQSTKNVRKRQRATKSRRDRRIWAEGSAARSKQMAMRSDHLKTFKHNSDLS